MADDTRPPMRIYLMESGRRFIARDHEPPAWLESYADIFELRSATMGHTGGAGFREALMDIADDLIAADRAVDGIRTLVRALEPPPTHEPEPPKGFVPPGWPT